VCSEAYAAGVGGPVQERMRAGEERARCEEGEEHLGGRLRDQARPHPRPRPGDLKDTGTPIHGFMESRLDTENVSKMIFLTLHLYGTGVCESLFCNNLR
jgi:hypothetical protein